MSEILQLPRQCLRLPLTQLCFSPQIAFVSKDKFPSGPENHSGSEVSAPDMIANSGCQVYISAALPPSLADQHVYILGPGMTYQHLHFDPADDFPELREIPGIQDNYAAYLQCLMQITQALTNAHDLLYPSKTHSFALATAEQYYKHIDEFTESKAASIGETLLGSPR